MKDPSITVPEAPSQTETDADREAEQRTEEETTEETVSPSEETETPEVTTEDPQEEVQEEAQEEVQEEAQEEPQEEAQETSEDTPEQTPTDTSQTGIYVPQEKPENPTMTPKGITTYDLYLEEVQTVSKALASLGDVGPVIYANNSLETWISYCLVTQMPLICVPTCVYPEAADTDYLISLFGEAYRQNPISGVLKDAVYSYEYESLVVTMCEEPGERYEKIVAELGKAKEIAGSVTSADMTDTEKIFAINDYLCQNASYDHDSTATDVDMDSLSTQFIDAHTPYGILVNNYGVCESYSEAFSLIGRYAGLNVVMETGDLQGGGHEWNRVYADGSWCIVDVTNNDMDLTSNALLNVAETQIGNILLPDGYAYMSDLTASDETKEYYYKNEKIANDSDSAVSLLLEQLGSDSVARVRLPVGASEEIASAIATEVAMQAGGLSQARMFANVLAVQK